MGQFDFSTGRTASGVVDKSLFDAHTILYATTDNTPVALTLTEQTLAGRLTGGNISAVALGISDNNIAQIDGTSNAPANLDYAKFTTSGLEGRSYQELVNDISGVIKATDVEVSELSAATYDDVQDYINFFGDRTLMSGGAETARADAITGVNTGGAGSASFEISGDLTATYKEDDTITVNGSTANDGNYTCKADSTHSAGTTTITVDEAVSDGTVDGSIYGAVDIASLTAWCKATDSDTAVGKFFDYAGGITAILTDLTTNYIYLGYNAGTPQLVVVTSILTHGFKQDHIHLGTAYRNGATLHTHKEDNLGVGRVNIVDMYHLEKGDAERASGLITTDGGSLTLSITAGVLYEGLSRHTTSPFATPNSGTADDTEANTLHDADGGFAATDVGKKVKNTTDTTYANVTAFVDSGQLTLDADIFVSGETYDLDIISYWYYNGSAWVEVLGQSTIDNLQYNNIASGLATLTANRYGVHWVFIDIDGDHIHIIYGQGDYTASQAEEAGVPASLPDIAVHYGVLIAKIIVQKSDTTLVISYPWTEAFTSSLATDHGSLAGLGDVADHDYALLHNGTRALSGAWDMGSQNLTNVNIDSGTIGGITLDGTLTGGADTAGVDVLLYGDVTGSYLLWDASEERLVISQGVTDAFAIELKSSDVAHGRTGIAPTDTYAVFVKSDGAGGGLKVHALQDSGGPGYTAMNFEARQAESPPSTKSTAGRGLMEWKSVQTSGNADANMVANGNAFVWRVKDSGGSTVSIQILDEDGDLWLKGGITVGGNIACGANNITLDATQTVDGIDVSAHDVATTGVHGAGANTILYSDHTADVDAHGEPVVTCDTNSATADDLAFSIVGGEGIDTSGATSVVTIAGEDATTANKGIASFDAQHFTLTAGAVDLNIDDTPVDGETDEPITSNWAFDHAALASAHGAVSVATASKIVLRDGEGQAKFAAAAEAGDALIKGTRVAVDELPAMTDEYYWVGTGANVEERAVPTAGATLTIAETEVYNANAPTAWTGLDLAGTIGAKASLVLLKVIGPIAKAMAFRKNGDADEFYSATEDADAAGCALIKTSNTVHKVVWVATDASGVVEWKCEAADATVIDVIAYIN